MVIVSRRHHCLHKKYRRVNKRTPGPKSNYSKVAGYKYNIQKTIAFEQSAFEIKKHHS